MRAAEPSTIEPEPELDLEPEVDPEELAMEAGLDDVRSAWARWNDDLPGVVRDWVVPSLLIGLALLLATWLVSRTVEPSGMPNPTFSEPPSFEHARYIFLRNVTVLALHAMICGLGYLALRSMPLLAEAYTGWRRTVHRAAGVVAIVFFAVVTIGSFTLQAWSLGNAAPDIALAYGLTTGELLLRVSVHAVPELAAIFLPCGAWLTLVLRRRWEDLFAASLLATAVALPILVICAIIETWVAPRLLLG